MNLRRVFFFGVPTAALVVCYTNSPWGRKARFAREQFYRKAYDCRTPPNWTGHLFNPKLDFHTASAVAEEKPWEEIDFKIEPEKYLNSVLEYCFTGNLENEFDILRNTRRKWYHAPWMCYHKEGREPIHGLTFERPAKPKDLSEKQTRVCQNWAIAMYNEPGKSYHILTIICIYAI